MTNPTIRAADSKDVPAVAGLNAEVQDLHVASRPDQFKAAQLNEIAQWLEQLLRNSSARLWVAEVDGEVVGYAAALARERSENPFCPARKWWDIDQLGVQARHRRAGIGRALVHHVVNEARAEGVRDLELNTWAFNQNAREAFTSLGFVPKTVRFELNTSPLELRDR